MVVDFPLQSPPPKNSSSRKREDFQDYNKEDQPHYYFAHVINLIEL